MNDIAPIGHNSLAELRTGDALRTMLGNIHFELQQRAKDLLAAEARIPAITDDDIAGKVSDYVKQLSALIKAADAARVAAKEPYLEGGRNVDGFFKLITDPATAAKKKTEQKLTAFLREKELQGRREREEQERQAREAAAKAAREAEELAQKARDEASLQTAIEAEEQASTAAADHAAAAKAAEVKAAELSRTRGEFGSVSSLRTVWTFENLDRAAIDLEALRQHLPMAALESAVRSFIRAGGRELKGVKIFETTATVVR